MALPTYQSSQAASGTTSAVITKPVSLAVNDILFADILGYSSGTISAPAGWTTINAQSLAGHARCTFYKVADAADVAASSFTFTATSTALRGYVTRITSDNPTTPFGAVSAASLAGLPTATGFTPTIGGGLYLMAIAYVTTDDIKTTSSYAIGTNNPSWTEAYDSNVTVSGVFFTEMALAYANRGAMTATGSTSFSFSPNSSNIVAAFIQLLNFVPALPAPLSFAASLPRPTIPQVVRAPFSLLSTVGTPTFADVEPVFRNIAKHVSTWLNPDKS